MSVLVSVYLPVEIYELLLRCTYAFTCRSVKRSRRDYQRKQMFHHNVHFCLQILTDVFQTIKLVQNLKDVVAFKCLKSISNKISSCLMSYCAYYNTIFVPELIT